MHEPVARPAWMDVAVHHEAGPSMEIAPAVQEQRWYTLACAPQCRNAGPWRVWAPEGDNFYCAACGELMTRAPT